VLVPVIVEREAEDRNADHRRNRDERLPLVLVRIRDVAGVHPAAVVAGDHVAPRRVGQAALHRHLEVRRQHRHDRILARRSRAQVDGLGGERDHLDLRLRGGTGGGEREEHGTERSVLHG
jgi:hypothetical protein